LNFFEQHFVLISILSSLT